MHNLFPRDMKFWSLAVYFLPPPWSVNKHESVVTHYKKERAHREDTDWPIPKSYRTLDKLYDGFCLVVDREDAWIGEGQNIDDEIEGTIEALEFEYNPTGDMIEDPSDQLPTPDSYVYSLNVASGIMFVVYDGIWGEEGQEEFYKRQQEHLAQYGIELD